MLSKVDAFGENAERYFFRSTADSMPDGAYATGTELYDLDTGKLYTYDGKNYNSATSSGWWEVI